MSYPLDHGSSDILKYINLIYKQRLKVRLKTRGIYRSQQNYSQIFTFKCKVAKNSRLLLAFIIVQNASFHMVYSDSMAIHGLRNESIFSNSNLGAMIVYQFLTYLSLYLLHSNKFFFNKSESTGRTYQKCILLLLLSFSCRIE